MKISCKIIEDLLPIYHDGICSEESAAMVEEHLKECPKCTEILTSLNGEFELEKPQSTDELKPLAEIQQRINREKKRCGRRNALIAAVLVIVMTPIFWLGWNQFTGSGICFSNLHERHIGEQFMKLLADGDYEKAYEYIDVEEIREEWLRTWFDAERLSDLENDGRTKFCEYGQRLEEAGGIEDYEYVGITMCSFDSNGEKTYRLVYKITYDGKSEMIDIDASQNGIDSFGCQGSFWDNPLAQFSLWSEYLWQDYEGCYFDTDLKQYVYYDKKQ